MAIRISSLINVKCEAKFAKIEKVKISVIALIALGCYLCIVHLIKISARVYLVGISTKFA